MAQQVNSFARLVRLGDGVATNVFPAWERFVPALGSNYSHGGNVCKGPKLVLANKARVLSDRGRLLKNNDWLLKILHLPLQPSQSPYLQAFRKNHSPLYLSLHLSLLFKVQSVELKVERQFKSLYFKVKIKKGGIGER